ncbi:MAG TPA: hypothetical protein VHG91_00165 [Longimicrobium sp.]|nr:hypothetical protein [Longimicrobium sp.]
MFDLYVTFSGLCLFAYRDKMDPLLVLLPPTGSNGHGGHGHVDHHVAVFGSREVYQPGSEVQPVNRFVEHVLGGGEIVFDRLLTQAGFDPSLDGFDVLDLSDITDTPARPDFAFARLALTQGEVWRDGAHDRGGVWQVEWDEVELETGSVRMSTRRILQHMTARVTWKVPGLTNQVEIGGELVDGLSARFRTSAGSYRTVKLQARDGRLRTYLFNVPGHEHLSLGRPGFTQLEPGTKAPHFEAFYALFHEPEAAPVPTFERRSLVLAPTFSDFGFKAASRKFFMFMGETITCTLAQARY